MRELLSFFIRHSKWFVFAIYMIAGMVLLFTNPYQHHVYLTSANVVSSTVYGISSNVSSYFDLRSINEELNERSAVLASENEALREQLRKLEDQLMVDTMQVPEGTFGFTVARVINNSIAHSNNYLTINKGRSDGLKTGMGVIDRNGVVGVINVTGEHASRVISLLNPDLKLSCKFKRNENFGSLVWTGKDPREALLEDLPRQTEYKAGDTIVTSGYSAVFPAGIPVGIVMDNQDPQTGNSITLKVRLTTDFTTLSNVQIVHNNLHDEIVEIEQ